MTESELKATLLLQRKTHVVALLKQRIEYFSPQNHETEAPAVYPYTLYRAALNSIISGNISDAEILIELAGNYDPSGLADALVVYCVDCIEPLIEDLDLD